MASPLHDHDRSKKTKAEVDYSVGMKARHCGICEHFRPPHSCTEVRGEIESRMWCKEFRKKG